MTPRNKAAMLIAVLLSALSVNTAIAKEKGDFLVRFGASNVNPDSNNHEIVSVESATSVTFNGSYMMTNHWAIEVLAALPFKHDIELLDGTRVGETKHLPPTVSFQFHFAPDASFFSPYVGLGVNYTKFFSEKTFGPLEDVDLDLSGSWGVAGELGADFILNDSWFLNASARYIDIETEARLDGTSIGDVAIDPWVYGLHVGYKF